MRRSLRSPLGNFPLGALGSLLDRLRLFCGALSCQFLCRLLRSLARSLLLSQLCGTLRSFVGCALGSFVRGSVCGFLSSLYRRIPCVLRLCLGLHCGPLGSQPLGSLLRGLACSLQLGLLSGLPCGPRRCLTCCLLSGLFGRLLGGTQRVLTGGFMRGLIRRLARRQLRGFMRGLLRGQIREMCFFFRLCQLGSAPHLSYTFQVGQAGKFGSGFSAGLMLRASLFFFHRLENAQARLFSCLRSSR